MCHEKTRNYGIHIIINKQDNEINKQISIMLAYKERSIVGAALGGAQPPGGHCLCSLSLSLYIYIYTHTYTYVYTHMYIYIYIYIHMYTYM